MMPTIHCSPASLLTESRLDPYFYDPMFVAHAALIRSRFARLAKLGDLFHVLDGTHDGVSTRDERDEVFCIPFLRAQDIGTGSMRRCDGAFLSLSDHMGKCKRSQIKKGDVLLNIRATTGEACVYSDGCPETANANRAVGILRPKSAGMSDTFKRTLCILLSSKIGNRELARNLKGSIQQRLNLEDIAECSFPLLGDSVHDYIGDKVYQAERLRERSSHLLSSATRLVELLIDRAISEDDVKSLGIVAVRNISPQMGSPPSRAKYTRTRSTELTDRIDAWYYQPHLVAAFERIMESGHCQSLADVIDSERDVKGGATPLGADYVTNGPVRFYRASDVSGLAVHAPAAVFLTTEQDREMARSRLAEGDILLTITGADFGHAGAISKHHLPGNISQHSVRFRPTIDASYLVAYLESSYGQLMLWRQAYGATRPAVDYPGVKSLLIRVPDRSVQELIGDAVRCGVLAREYARSLVAAAKSWWKH